MKGMTVTDNWYLNDKFPSPLTIKRKRITFSADEIENSLLEYAAALSYLTLIPRENSILASPVMHTKKFNTTGQRRCLWCFRTSAKISETKMFYIQCSAGICDTHTPGRNCWALHVEWGGPPKSGYICKPSP